MVVADDGGGTADVGGRLDEDGADEGSTLDDAEG